MTSRILLNIIILVYFFSAYPAYALTSYTKYVDFLKRINAKGTDYPYDNETIREQISKLASTDEKRYNHVKEFSKKLTFDELFHIDSLGGIYSLSLVDGCKSKCLGCGERANLANSFTRMSWNDFEFLVLGFMGLERIFNDFLPSNLRFRFFSELIPYLNSDPMEIYLMFHDKDGKKHVKTVYDAYKLLSTEGSDSFVLVLVTSGWTNSSDGPYKLLKAFFRGELNIKKIEFNLKLLTAPVLQEYAAFLARELKDNQAFMEKYGKDFAQYGIDFAKYPGQAEAHFQDTVIYKFIFKEALASKFMRESVRLKRTMGNLEQILRAYGEVKAEGKLSEAAKVEIHIPYVALGSLRDTKHWYAEALLVHSMGPSLLREELNKLLSSYNKSQFVTNFLIWNPNGNKRTRNKIAHIQSVRINVHGNFVLSQNPFHAMGPYEDIASEDSSIFTDTEKLLLSRRLLFDCSTGITSVQSELQ